MAENKKHQIGEICPESGFYELVEHDDVSNKQALIPLAKGNRFPPCRNCNHKVEWVLVRKAELQD